MNRVIKTWDANSLISFSSNIKNGSAIDINLYFIKRSNLWLAASAILRITLVIPEVYLRSVAFSRYPSKISRDSLTILSPNLETSPLIQAKPPSINSSWFD